MATKTAQIPNQGNLLVTNEQTGRLHIAQEALPEANLSVSPGWEDGISVDLLERNARLQNVLRRLGVMSRTVGLQIASESGARSDLESRYEAVDELVGNAVDKSDRKYLEAKKEYAKAFGLQQMIDSGQVTAEEAKTMARSSFKDEVIPLFADAKGAKNRDVMKRWMNHQERKLTGKTTRRPKVSRPTSTKVV